MTHRFAIFGNPVSHSKSPQIYQNFAAQFGIELTYERIEAPIDGFREAFLAFRDAGGKGGNITMPFKLDAYAAATRRMPRAELAGAVNCYKFEGDEIIVENFDGLGLVNDIQLNMGMKLEGKRVLLLGAGGAVRGALQPFLEARPSTLTIANRTISKGEELRARLAGHGDVEAIGYDALKGRQFDAVINATSLSLSGECPPIPASAFAPGALAYEMVYGKGLTPFLKHAIASGAGLYADGVGMLVEQGVEAFQWWNGVRPNSAPVIKMLTVPLV